MIKFLVQSLLMQFLGVISVIAGLAKGAIWAEKYISSNGIGNKYLQK